MGDSGPCQLYYVKAASRVGFQGSLCWGLFLFTLSKLFTLEALKPLSVCLHIIHRLTLNSGQSGLLRKAPWELASSWWQSGGENMSLPGWRSLLLSPLPFCLQYVLFLPSLLWPNSHSLIYQCVPLDSSLPEAQDWRLHLGSRPNNSAEYFNLWSSGQ